MKNWAFVFGVLVALVGCGSVDPVAVESAGAGGADDPVEVAGAAGEIAPGSAGSNDLAGAGGADALGGSAGASVAGSSGALAGGSAGVGGVVEVGGSAGAPVAGSGGVGGTSDMGGSGVPVVAGTGGTGGVAGSSGSSVGGSASAGSPAGGSAGMGASAGAAGSGAGGVPGTACPAHTLLESISPTSHRITHTFPAYVNVVAADLSPLAGYNVIPFVDGVQSAKAFAGGSMWLIPPDNRMKSIAFELVPNTTTPVMPATGLALFCK